MIKFIRLYTGTDGQSHVEKKFFTLIENPTNTLISAAIPVKKIHFAESPAKSSSEWHNAPHLQYVITLSGTLEFTTREGESFQIGPGDILLAEDTGGGGHRWRLIDNRPWRRLYIEVDPMN